MEAIPTESKCASGVEKARFKVNFFVPPFSPLPHTLLIAIMVIFQIFMTMHGVAMSCEE